MKIIKLQAENFKRLHAVRIEPNGRLALITGRNAQGKSSVLDAIAAALGGKDAVPSKPVREGAEHAKVVVDLGDLVVTRKFSGGRTTLVVESKDGLKHPSPQAVLDKMAGRLTFDPLAFSRMPAKHQAQTLRELVPGLDTTALDIERKAAFDKRTDLNRDVKALQAQLDALPIVNAPDEEVSLAELAKQHRAAAEKHAADERVRERAARAAVDLGNAKAAVWAAEQALAKAQEQLVEAEGALARLNADVERLDGPDPEDLNAITVKMATAEQTNAAVRAKKARAAKAAELAKREEAAAALTAKIKDVDERKAAALVAAKLPVAGLTVDGDTVALNGVPFEQASSAEQLRAGLAIGAALNPTLRIVLVRDGSLLDEASMRLVADWADANDMQVWMERVEDGAASGVVIEDGEVVADLASRGLALVPPPDDGGDQLQLDDVFPEPGV